jgi:hypothetical protein
VGVRAFGPRAAQPRTPLSNLSPHKAGESHMEIRQEKDSEGAF